MKLRIDEFLGAIAGPVHHSSEGAAILDQVVHWQTTKLSNGGSGGGSGGGAR